MNNDLREKKTDKLRELGGFRTLARGWNNLRRRISRARWSEKARRVGRIVNGMIEDADLPGTFLPIKEVLLVPYASTEARREPRGEQMTRENLRKRTMLEPYLLIIEAILGQEENRLATPQTIYQTIPRSEVVQALREAGASSQNPLRTTTQTFPETLSQYGNKSFLIN